MSGKALVVFHKLVGTKWKRVHKVKRGARRSVDFTKSLAPGHWRVKLVYKGKKRFKKSVSAPVEFDIARRPSPRADILSPAMTGEQRSIEASEAPITVERLAADLRALGVRPASVLLVHASVTALGWVCGGAQAVALALREALGPEGTLVVPTHSNNNSDPSEWGNPPVPEAWWPVIRAEMPAYDPAVTPSLLGALTNVVRTWPGALRSAPPALLVRRASGPAAEEITAGHELTSGLGERSPLARVHDLDGDVLLLGVGHGSNTSMHLAEYRVAQPRYASNGAAVATASGREWVDLGGRRCPTRTTSRRSATRSTPTGAVRVGPTGIGESRLMSQRELVAFTVRWMDEHRRGARAA